MRTILIEQEKADAMTTFLREATNNPSLEVVWSTGLRRVLKGCGGYQGSPDCPHYEVVVNKPDKKQTVCQFGTANTSLNQMKKYLTKWVGEHAYTNRS